MADIISEIKSTVFDMVVINKSNKDLIDITHNIDDYLFKLYMDHKINGFTGSILEKEIVRFDVQGPSDRGSYGWITLSFLANHDDKHNKVISYNRAMKGI